jgi:quercetin dioxygenase-like cupin family protein
VVDQLTRAWVAADTEDGEPLWGLGGLLIVKIPSASTGDGFAVLEERMQRGCATPPHVHRADDETFIVLEGELALWVDGQQTIARPGTVSYVPGGLTHAWRVESELARTLVITTAQHEAFYRECCEPAPAPVQPPFAGKLDPGVIACAAAHHGVQLLGPPWTDTEPVFERAA